MLKILGARSAPMEQAQAIWDNFREIVAARLLAGSTYTVDIPAGTVNTDVTIRHGLGRQPTGYIPTRVSNATVVDEVELSSELLTLTVAKPTGVAGDTASITLWVY